MKRLSVIAFALTVALSTYAYYDDYSGSSSSFEMPGWFTFMGVVMIIWGVLEIILFFKIWGMTNDVKAMKKDMFNETAFSSDAELAQFVRKNIVLGNIENIKRILLQNFMDTIKNRYNTLRQYSSLSTEEIMQIEIKSYIETLQKQFDIIGEKLPVYIQRMATFDDYFSLFKKEDLKYKELQLSDYRKNE